MKRENRRNILFRYGSITVLILLLTVRIVYKLVDNTVLSADKWNARAEKMLSEIDTIMPVRGDILAADGSVLATNMRVYTPCIDFRADGFKENLYRENIPALADSLARYFPFRTRDGWIAYLNKPLEKERGKRSRSFPVVRNVSYAEVRLIKSFPFMKERKSKTGLHVEDRLDRVRPYGDMARRSIGAVGVEDTINVPFGKYGLERSLNALLAGTPGYSKKVSLTKAIVDWTDRAPVDGYTVLTTIDIKMQDLLENELNKVLNECKPEWGTAILMEVGSGDIKAIASLERSKTTGDYIESLNYAVRRYEPGSVIKTLTMMTLLEDGKVPDVNEKISAHAYSKYGCRFSDHHGMDSIPVSRILEVSSNVGITRLADRAYASDPGRFYSRIKLTGVLDPISSGIAEEVVPTCDSLNVTRRYDLLSQSFGYTTEFSPLYTASIYNAIANGGKYVRPRLVRGMRGNGLDTVYPVSYINPQVCTPEHAAQLREMLHRVVWGDKGTARHIVRSDKVEIAGKTGTAFRFEVGKGYNYSQKRLAFCGFFPYEKPRYTCMVLIAYPTEKWFGAEYTSGRVVRNMAEQMYARGMLGNSSDYVADTEAADGAMRVYHAGNHGRLHARLNTGTDNRAIREPEKAVEKGAVPDVIGLSLPEAVRVLETAGYNVTFTGVGYVAGQSPAAGIQAPPGQQIKLALTNKFLSKN